MWLLAADPDDESASDLGDDGPNRLRTALGALRAMLSAEPTGPDETAEADGEDTPADGGTERGTTET